MLIPLAQPSKLNRRELFVPLGLGLAATYRLTPPWSPPRKPESAGSPAAWGCWDYERYMEITCRFRPTSCPTAFGALVGY